MRSQAELETITAREILPLFTLQAVLFTAAGLGLWYASGRSAAAFVVVDPHAIFWGLALAATMIAFAYGVFRGVPEWGDHLVRLQRENFAFLKQPFSLAAIVWLSICAGVGEEALFRGGLQTLLTDYIGATPAILIASALFALIHLGKPILTALIFVIGVLFGYVYAQTGSLLLVMIAHTVYDVFAIWYLRRRMFALGLFDVADETTREEGSTNATD
ncbi:MAG: CPBP family intramembrane glutamic endopeptidase [Pontixanthobacter sp.]